MNEDLDMQDALEAFVDRKLARVWTMLPGVVRDVSADGLRVTVQPTVCNLLNTGEQVEIAPIDNVPVQWPMTARGGMISRLQAGDGVMLMFGALGFGGYLSQNEVEVTDADSLLRHGLADCVAVPGLFPFSMTPTDVPETGCLIWHENTTVKIDKGVSIKDGHGNTVVADSGGVTINGHLKVTR